MKNVPGNGDNEGSERTRLWFKTNWRPCHEDGWSHVQRTTNMDILLKLTVSMLNFPECDAFVDGAYKTLLVWDKFRYSQRFRQRRLNMKGTFRNDSQMYSPLSPKKRKRFARQSRKKTSPNNFTMREPSDANGVNQCYNVLCSMTINYLWAAYTGCHMWNWGAYARVLNSCLPIFICTYEYSTSDNFFGIFKCRGIWSVNSTRIHGLKHTGRSFAAHVNIYLSAC